MKLKFGKRLLAGLLGATMTFCALGTAAASAPTVGAVEDNTTQVYYNDFETEVGLFSGRGGVETLALDTTDAYAGSSCLKVSDRTSSWHGPWIRVSDFLEAGVQYTVSAYVKADWYDTITLSTDTTDSAGNRSYANLASASYTGDGNWVSFDAVKFSVPTDCESFYLYFECSDTSPIYIDEFEIRTAQVYEPEDIAALKDVYANYFKLGTAVTASELASSSTQSLVLKHFNSITPGNELKPDAVLDQTATLANYQETGDNTTVKISLSSAASILNFAAENNIPVRGHVLVWHQQTPEWFFKEGFDAANDWVDADTMTARMECYIKTVMETLATEYPDVEFYAWDVVNEAAGESGTMREPGTDSSQSPWVQVYGDQSYIKLAFQFARQYAPEGCKLCYNDYNEYIDAKMNYIVSDILTPLIEDDLIDVMGMQSHLDISFPSISAYRKALQTYTDLGLELMVTELDATVSDNTDELFETQAQYYSDLFDLYVEFADNIDAVVLWGTTDDQSWRASRYPLLFNEDFTAKPAYYAIVDGMEVTPGTTTTTEETAETTTTTTETTTETSTETTVQTTDTTTNSSDSSSTVLETTTTTTTSGTSETSSTTTTDASGATTTTTESSSDAQSSETTTTAAPEDAYGDTNGDGDVSLADAVLLAQYIAGMVQLDEGQEACSDVNQDGRVDDVDGTVMLRFLANAILSLPYTE